MYRYENMSFNSEKEKNGIHIYQYHIFSLILYTKNPEIAEISRKKNNSKQKPPSIINENILKTPPTNRNAKNVDIEWQMSLVDIDSRDRRRRYSQLECDHLLNDPHHFQVITPSRSLVLCAETRRDMEEWLSALKGAVPGGPPDMLNGDHHWYVTFECFNHLIVYFYVTSSSCMHLLSDETFLFIFRSFIS